jgi:alkylation response protein AidB-like acyl-CoA dehydrogenase
MATTVEQGTLDVTVEVKAWLESNWDPDLTVGEWWEKLGDSGWAAPSWPVEWHGRGLGREDAIRALRALADFGALGPPGGLGLLLAGPTILTHGTDDQKRRYLRDIVTGRKAWCQLFSEPGAGSDLAGLQTKAVKDGEEWVINGQKVWTSGGRIADLGMLVARTNPDVPKHQGITYFAFSMRQPGVDVRPLREITGRALFNEVFITDARVADDALIGGLNKGWAVANTTLAFERAGLGAGGGSAGTSAAQPGTLAGDLDKRAGDFVRRSPADGGPALSATTEQILIKLATDNGKVTDPTVRQDLMQLHTYNEIARFTNLRQKAARAAGVELPGVGNLAKLSMSKIVRLSREIGLRILGPLGTLHAYSLEDRRVLDAITANPLAGVVTEMALFSPGPSIYGGTDEVQKNIIGERVLGLPKEPSNDRVVPFRELPKNG